MVRRRLIWLGEVFSKKSSGVESMSPGGGQPSVNLSFFTYLLQDFGQIF